MPVLGAGFGRRFWAPGMTEEFSLKRSMRLRLNLRPWPRLQLSQLMRWRPALLRRGPRAASSQRRIWHFRYLNRPERRWRVVRFYSSFSLRFLGKHLRAFFFPKGRPQSALLPWRCQGSYPRALPRRCQRSFPWRPFYAIGRSLLQRTA